MSEYNPASTYGTEGSGSTEPSDVAASASAARDKAADAAQAGRQAAGEVAQTASTAARDVAQETKSQARELAGRTGEQFTEQAEVQKGALVEGLRSLVDQLDAMTERADRGGIAVEVAGKARDAARSTADWLDGRDPGEVLDGVRSFGRERTGVYLAGSLLAGVVAGRLTRGVAAVHTDDSGEASTPGAAPGGAAEPAGSVDFGATRSLSDSGSSPSGPGRHEERFTDSDINSGSGLHSDSGTGSRPAPGQPMPGQPMPGQTL